MPVPPDEEQFDARMPPWVPGPEEADYGLPEEILLPSDVQQQEMLDAALIRSPVVQMPNEPPPGPQQQQVPQDAAADQGAAFVPQEPVRFPTGREKRQQQRQHWQEVHGPPFRLPWLTREEKAANQEAVNRRSRMQLDMVQARGEREWQEELRQPPPAPQQQQAVEESPILGAQGGASITDVDYVIDVISTDRAVPDKPRVRYEPAQVTVREPPSATVPSSLSVHSPQVQTALWPEMAMPTPPSPPVQQPVVSVAQPPAPPEQPRIQQAAVTIAPVPQPQRPLVQAAAPESVAVPPSQGVVTIEAPALPQAQPVFAPPAATPVVQQSPLPIETTRVMVQSAAVSEQPIKMPAAPASVTLQDRPLPSHVTPAPSPAALVQRQPEPQQELPPPVRVAMETLQEMPHAPVPQAMPSPALAAPPDKVVVYAAQPEQREASQQAFVSDEPPLREQVVVTQEPRVRTGGVVGQRVREEVAPVMGAEGASPEEVAQRRWMPQEQDRPPRDRRYVPSDWRPPGVSTAVEVAAITESGQDEFKLEPVRDSERERAEKETDEAYSMAELTDHLASMAEMQSHYMHGCLSRLRNIETALMRSQYV